MRKRVFLRNILIKHSTNEKSDFYTPQISTLLLTKGQRSNIFFYELVNQFPIFFHRAKNHHESDWNFSYSFFNGAFDW